MANKEGHRRFGNARKLPSGRFQIRYPGPDGRLRTGPETYGRKSDADKALVLVEAQLNSGEWTDPERGKVKLGEYAARWITERPKLRPRTIDLYRWLLAKHLAPHLGGVPVGKVSTAMIREWRATLPVSVTAKAYRLLRAVLMTAVEEDKILPRNPCRIRGAGDEETPERPVLTVAQVFALAELVGRRPVGNIRNAPAGGYQLRFRRHGEFRTSPEVYGTRTEAEQALWKMADDGRADCNHDRRYLALVLLATFASLRWGEVTALRRPDLDLSAGTVRVRAAFVERSTGEILLGPPKSKAGRRVVGIPQAIIPVLREHLSVFVTDEPGALVFPGAASSGAGLRDLMARMGHDSERAALIYQHEARGADQAITGAIDSHVQAERGKDAQGDDDDGQAGALAPVG